MFFGFENTMGDSISFFPVIKTQPCIRIQKEFYYDLDLSK